MNKTAKALPLLLEFVGAATIGLVVLATNGRTTFPFFGAFVAGLTYAGLIILSRPNYVVQLNPIVTFGLWTARKLSSLRTLVTIGLQMLGGLAAWRFSEYLLDQPLQNIAGDRFDTRVFVAELVGAFIFTFLLSMVVYRKPLHENGLVAAGFIGVVTGMLVASLGDNGLINPSLALALQSWSWTYVLGPLVGGFVGMSVVPVLEAFDRRGTRTNTVKKEAVSKAKKTVKKAKKATKK